MRSATPLRMDWAMAVPSIFEAMERRWKWDEKMKWLDLNSAGRDSRWRARVARGQTWLSMWGFQITNDALFSLLLSLLFLRVSCSLSFDSTRPPNFFPSAGKSFRLFLGLGSHSIQKFLSVIPTLNNELSLRPSIRSFMYGFTVVQNTGSFFHSSLLLPSLLGRSFCFRAAATS